MVESRDELPGPDVWLLARRSVSDPTEVACYLAWAPSETPLHTLARVALRLAWSDWRRATWLRVRQSHDRQRARQAAAADNHDTS